MAKAFLSHSSKQKESYVEIVAKQLGLNNCIYDSFSFEEGMKNMDEIKRGMNNSDIFVLFLSDSALDSEWVQREIFDSYDLLHKGNLKSIFPIIIDEKINHNDPRIPEWMKNEYNLQYVSRPTIATRRIKQRLIELSWDFHPMLKERQNLFVGRNSLIDSFEQRIDTFEYPSPVAYFVCGFKHIGRRSLIKQSLRKTSIIRESYSFPSITIEIDESIEDFIRKVYDLGFSTETNIENLLFQTVDVKIDICVKLLKDLSHAKEIIQIIDNGGIISPNGELSEWFDQIIKNLEGNNKLFCVIASRYRIYRGSINNKPYIFNLNITELDNENLDKFLSTNPSSIKGRRELVQVLIDIEDYEGALSYAKVIFENEKLNPYNIQAYIRCLLRVRPADYKKTVETLIETLSIIDTDISKEMYYSAKANFISVFENNEIKALAIINQCIEEFPETPFPLVTKLEICEKFRNTIEMENTLKVLKLNNPRANTYTNTNIAFEAKLLALKGNISQAISLVDSKLSHKLPSSAIDKLKQILYNY